MQSKIHFVLLYLSLLAFTPIIYAASIHDFETTRLKSSAGAGVGSILLEEATVLNPSSFPYFNLSSLYFQKSGADISGESTLNRRGEVKSGSKALIISDARAGSGGGFSYVEKTEAFNARKRFSLSYGRLVSKQSSMGLTYRVSRDKLSEDGLNIEKKNYNQIILGVSHIVSKSITLGMVVIDPQKSKPEDTLAIIGGQYVYKDFISLMLDAGANYNQDLSTSLLYRAAIQFKMLNGLFLRVGTFDDKGKQERGNGVGMSWIQPKLAIDVAMKNTKVNESLLLNQKGERIKESSFSISYRF